MISEKQHERLTHAFRRHPEHADRKSTRVILDVLCEIYVPNVIGKLDEFKGTVIDRFCLEFNPERGTPVGTLIKVIKQTPVPEEEEERTNYHLNLFPEGVVDE